MTHETELVWQAPWGATGWTLAALVALGALLVGILSSAGRPPALRIALAALRAVAVAGVLLLLLRPGWRRADVTRSRDHVLVLVDASASMGLPAEGGASRAVAAQRWLNAAGPALRGLGARWAVETLRFDQGLRGQTPAGVGTPMGRATDLLGALDAARGRYRGRRLAGVVLLSDGRDTVRLREGVDPQAAARLRALDVPVNVVPLGGAGVKDAAVEEVITDDLAFVRNVARVRATLRVVGTAEPVTAELWLDGEVVAARSAAGGEERSVVFEVTPARVGHVTGRVTVRPVHGEATPANNTRRFVLRVVRDRVRILQIAGRPSWDVRFLRQHLKRDPNVDLVSFFILRTHLNRTYAAPHELSLIQFPAEELFSSHLDGFDLVVMQDFERYPPYVGAYLDNIAAWVRRGGALALTGGEHTLSLGGFAGSQLAGVLPVVLLPEGGAASTQLDESTFRPRWTALSQQHPVTRGGGGDGLSPEALAALPPLEGVNKVAGPHPEAAVLAEHPRLKDARGRPLPVLALRDVEAGRALALLTDTSWRWQFEAEGSSVGTYDAFWRRAVRYLIGDPEFQRLRVLTRHVPYPAGGPAVRLTVVATDARRQPEAGVRVAWRLLQLEGDLTPAAPAPGRPSAARSPGAAPPTAAPGGPGASPSTPPQAGAVERRSGAGDTDAEGRLTVDLGALPPGAYRLEAKAVLGGRQVRARGVLVTEGSAPELARVEPAPALLRALAHATGGRVLRGPDDLGRAAFHAPRVVTLDRLRTVPLVGSLWLLLGIIVLSLAAEWALRRRFALA